MKFGNSGTNQRHGKVYFSKSHFMSDKKKREEETKRHEKAAALRKYAKLCEKEGIVSSRVNIKNAPKVVVQNEDNDVEQTAKPKKKQVEKQPEIEDPDKAREERERQIREASESRKEKRKAMMQRTKKGQPVMKNQITSILGKLLSQK